MRLNRYIALSTGISRRAADAATTTGHILVEGKPATAGQQIAGHETVTLDGRPVTLPAANTTIMLNKPLGYVSSRDGQGSKTIYDLLPKEFHKLKPIGRLDKDSSGLLLLTDDGELAQQLTHPSYEKTKVYEVKLDKELTPEHFESITKPGVELYDGLSKLGLDYMNSENYEWKVTMHEGRNRQIRRTFAVFGYTVIRLHRIRFGNYALGKLHSGRYTVLIH